MGFLIYALPRSRTFWLSNFFSFAGWTCGHDELRHVRGLDDIKSLLNMPNYGSVETAAAPWWRLMHAMKPELNAAVIRRPVEDVVESLMATGVVFERSKLTETMTRLDAKLDQIEARVPGVLSVRFEDLSNKETCAALVWHCMGEAFSDSWWNAFAPMNLTCDLRAMTRYMHAHMPQLERAAQQAKQSILAGMTRRTSMECMTFQTETFAATFRDAERLFKEHCVAVGETPGNFMNKNLPLLEKMDDLGVLQILTARSNGRMFGYLVTIVSPTLESQTDTIATHTLFYASPAVPTLGRKMLNEAAARLRERGVTELVMRAGPRGDGPRLSKVYQRMGAVDDGAWFRLNLRAA